MPKVIRIFVEKRQGMNIVADQTKWDLRHNLGIKNIEELRFINRYDIEGLSQEDFDKAKNIVLSEPNQDVIYEETLPVEEGWKVFAMEYLPDDFVIRQMRAEYKKQAFLEDVLHPYVVQTENGYISCLQDEEGRPYVSVEFLQ